MGAQITWLSARNNPPPRPRRMVYRRHCFHRRGSIDGIVAGQLYAIRVGKVKRLKGGIGHRRISDYEPALNGNTAIGRYTRAPVYVDVKEVLGNGCDAPIDLRCIVLGWMQRLSAKSGKSGCEISARDTDSPEYVALAAWGVTQKHSSISQQATQSNRHASFASNLMGKGHGIRKKR